jgi:hypothetical protein
MQTQPGLSGILRELEDYKQLNAPPVGAEHFKKSIYLNRWNVAGLP